MIYRQMKKAFVLAILIFIIVITVISFNFSVFAQEKESTPSPTPIDYILPYPGILPDHPLYFLKVVRDKILEFVTKDSVKKVHLDLLLSDKHLVMGKLLWEKGNLNLSTTTFLKGERYLLTASLELIKLKDKNALPPGLSDKLELAAKKHEEVINDLVTQVSDEGRKKEFNEAVGITHQATQQILSVK